MTDLAIGEDLNMNRNRDQRRGLRRIGSREVIVTWLIAGLLLGALALLPNHAGKTLRGGAVAMLAQIAPAAGPAIHHAHHDGEGPKDAGECSDRDYANELC
jgi:hypothetical protein